MKLGLVVLAFSFLTACGGNPCDALKCANCDTAGHKTACDILVKSNTATACSSALSKPEYATCK